MVMIWVLINYDFVALHSMLECLLMLCAPFFFALTLSQPKNQCKWSKSLFINLDISEILSGQRSCWNTANLGLAQAQLSTKVSYKQVPNSVCDNFLSVLRRVDLVDRHETYFVSTSKNNVQLAVTKRNNQNREGPVVNRHVQIHLQVKRNTVLLLVTAFFKCSFFSTISHPM